MLVRNDQYFGKSTSSATMCTNLSNDEKTRAAAEAFIHSQVDTNFGQFLDELLKGITLQDPMVFCAIIKTDSKLDG